MTELAHDLIQDGFDIPKDVLEIDEMAELLCHLK